MLKLPIDDVLPELTATLRERGAVVLHAPTGAGKTTRVPPALLDTLPGGGEILVLEPRRVAARAAAVRMAQERGERVGRTFGYQVRFDRTAGPETRVLVVTEGVLLQRLVSDPFLEGVAAVVFDEVHERGIDADTAIAVTRAIQRDLRPELKIVAMSATVDTDTFARFLDAPVIRASGRMYPVDVRYLPRPDERPAAIRAADHAARLFAETDGDVLVFLPGAGEIRRALEALADARLDAELLPLHGRLDPEDQDRVLTPSGRRRIIVATNVAETSLTIPGVTAVVDTGLARVQRHDPRRGLDRLDVEPISRASADQRAGRAGRTAPGVALRLWTELQHRERAAHDTPEIRRVDLCSTVLGLLAWGEPDPRAFGWLEAPAAHALDAAFDLLDRLGATEAGKLTPLGHAMAGLPAHPRIARLLVEGHRRGVLHRVALAAAILEEREPFVRDGAPPHASESDLLDLLEAVDGVRSHGWRPRHPGVIPQLRVAARQLADRARARLGASTARGGDEDVLRALAAAWPDRIAARRPDSNRLVLANGRGAVLGPRSAVQAPVIVVLDVMDTDDAEARVALASRVDPAWLPTVRVASARFDDEEDRVFTASELRFGALVLDRRLGATVEPAVLEQALLEGAQRRLERALPEDNELPRLADRLKFLHRTRPDLGLPAGDRAWLESLAAGLVRGRRTLAELRRALWHAHALEQLSWTDRAALDRFAPDRLHVPSGSAIRVDYPEEGPPVLAVRMQEMFGCTDTPRIEGQKVMLHLLAPNGRPQQVTQDLAGFWERTWPEVRRELRARYPKHSWPDDPRAAPPQRKGRPPER